MVPRRALHLVNGSASHILVKPFVVMAARVLGPGPTRLKLVKLAHNLTAYEVLTLDDEHPAPSGHPTQRAA